jgi:hypothetical protein
MQTLKTLIALTAAVVVATLSLIFSVWIGAIALKAAFVPLALVVGVIELSLSLLIGAAIILASISMAAVLTIPFLAALGVVKVAAFGC